MPALKKIATSECLEGGVNLIPPKIYDQTGIDILTRRGGETVYANVTIKYYKE